jgi:hypothetical protein
MAVVLPSVLARIWRRDSRWSRRNPPLSVVATQIFLPSMAVAMGIVRDRQRHRGKLIVGAQPCAELQSASGLANA